MFSTKSYNINIIRAAVSEYQAKHGNFGDLRVVASHFSESDFTAQGYAESALDGVVIEVERIAGRRERERQERRQRVEALRLRHEAGEISQDEYLTEAYCFI